MFGIAFFLNENIAASQARKSEEALYKQLQLFSDVLSIVKNNYVDQVESQKLIYGALKGMLSSLDPYSTFLEPEVYKDLEIDPDFTYTWWPQVPAGTKKATDYAWL